MSARRTHRSTTLGLVLLAAALGVSLFSFALGPIWSLVLSMVPIPSASANTIHAIWIPLSGVVVDVAAFLLGLLGFSLVWGGRAELGGPFASRVGLSMLAILIAGVADILFGATGILLAYVSGAEFLVPWHSLFAIVGGVFLGLGLYWILANLPISGARPLAAVALALGLGGIALVNLAIIGLRRVRTAGLDGAGLGLALASLTLWLVLCLWAEENLRTRPSAGPASTAVDGT